jgi:hypothetical protein
MLVVTEPLNLVLEPGNLFAQLAEKGLEFFTGGLND